MKLLKLYAKLDAGPKNTKREFGKGLKFDENNDTNPLLDSIK
jgi:hypothetical protein